MQFTSQFTIAIHTLTVIDRSQDQEKVTSSLIASSVGVNPVIIRKVMGKLKECGLINISQGKTGITLNKALDAISFYDIYLAVEEVEKSGLFRLHEEPNPNCVIGRNIHLAMEDKLQAIQQSMEDEMKAISIAEVAQDIPLSVD